MCMFLYGFCIINYLCGLYNQEICYHKGNSWQHRGNICYSMIRKNKGHAEGARLYCICWLPKQPQGFLPNLHWGWSPHMKRWEDTESLLLQQLPGTKNWVLNCWLHLIRQNKKSDLIWRVTWKLREELFMLGFVVVWGFGGLGWFFCLFHFFCGVVCCFLWAFFLLVSFFKVFLIQHSGILRLSYLPELVIVALSKWCLATLVASWAVVISQQWTLAARAISLLPREGNDTCVLLCGNLQGAG